MGCRRDRGAWGDVGGQTDRRWSCVCACGGCGCWFSSTGWASDSLFSWRADPPDGTGPLVAMMKESSTRAQTVSRQSMIDLTIWLDIRRAPGAVIRHGATYGCVGDVGLGLRGVPMVMDVTRRSRLCGMA